MVIGEVPIGAEVLVLGAGRAGTAAAVALARRGRRVVVADEAGAGGLTEHPGITVLVGRARFSTPRRVAVSDGATVVHVEATDVVVATGRAPTPRGEARATGPAAGTAPWVVAAVEARLGAWPTVPGAAVADLGLDPVRAPRRADGSLVTDPAGRVGPHLWAVGGAGGRPPGVAAAEALALCAALHGEPAWFDPGAVPVLVVAPDGWSALSIGAVDGVRRGRAAGVGTAEVELVADEAGSIVGVHAVGLGVAGLAHAATLAVELALTCEELCLVAAPGDGALLARAALAVASAPAVDRGP